MDNVKTLVPRKHWQFDIWETKNGYHAEFQEQGQITWEYESELLGKVTAMILTTIANFDDKR